MFTSNAFLSILAVGFINDGDESSTTEAPTVPLNPRSSNDAMLAGGGVSEFPRHKTISSHRNHNPAHVTASNHSDAYKTFFFPSVTSPSKGTFSRHQISSRVLCYSITYHVISS